MTRRHALIAAALTLAAWGEQLAGGRDDLPLHLLLAALMCGSLVAVSRPVVPVAGQSIALLVFGLRGIEPDATGEIIALWASAWAVGAHLGLRAGAVVMAAFVAVLAAHFLIIGAAGDAVFALVVVPPWLLGGAMARRVARIAELERLTEELVAERERAAELAAAAERARLARDIQSVLAATLSDVAARARDGEAGRDESFEALHARAGEAAAELRRLLGVLHA